MSVLPTCEGFLLILIEGARLSEVMIRVGVGEQVKDGLGVVEIDEDFFE